MDRHLTIDEKRDRLAAVVRDESGEFSLADKLKAMVEDTKLAQLAEENRRAAEERAAAQAAEKPAELRWDLLAHLPPPCAPDAPKNPRSFRNHSTLDNGTRND